MQIAILIYDRLTALDAVGPYEVLSRLPGAELTFVAQEPGPKRTDTGRLALVADASLAEVPHPDVVLVPGGPAQAELMEDGPLHEWLRAAHETSTWTASVCTGSLILAAAGVLAEAGGRSPSTSIPVSTEAGGHAPSARIPVSASRRATTHWQALEELRRLGVEAVEERVVFDGKFVTAAGVSAGIDMALALVARIAGEQVAQAIQLGIEYDPQPPFDAGSPHKAPAAIVEAVCAYSRFESVST
jgi:transcriptional regulator GlxA family with amidase domain